jgi:hypothetical protein
MFVIFLSCEKKTLETENDRLDKLRTTCEQNFQATCNSNGIITEESFSGKINGKQVCLYVGNNNYKSYFSSPEIISTNTSSVTTGQGSIATYNIIGASIWGPNTSNAFSIQSPQLPINMTAKEYVQTYFVPEKKLPINGKGQNNINVFSVIFGLYCDDPLRNGKNENGQIILTSGYLMFGSWAGPQLDDAYLKVKTVDYLGGNSYLISFEMKCNLYSEMDHHYFGKLEDGKFSIMINI